MHRPNTWRRQATVLSAFSLIICVWIDVSIWVANRPQLYLVSGRALNSVFFILRQWSRKLWMVGCICCSRIFLIDSLLIQNWGILTQKVRFAAIKDKCDCKWFTQVLQHPTCFKNFFVRLKSCLGAWKVSENCSTLTAQHNNLTSKRLFMRCTFSFLSYSRISCFIYRDTTRLYACFIIIPYVVLLPMEITFLAPVYVSIMNCNIPRSIEPKAFHNSKDGSLRRGVRCLSLVNVENILWCHTFPSLFHNSFARWDWLVALQ